MMRRHLIVATYCCKMSLVSAPGWSNRFWLLNVSSAKNDRYMRENEPQNVRFAQWFDQIGSLINTRKGFLQKREKDGMEKNRKNQNKITDLKIVQCSHRIWEIDDDVKYFLRPVEQEVSLGTRWYISKIYRRSQRVLLIWKSKRDPTPWSIVFASSAI